MATLFKRILRTSLKVIAAGVVTIGIELAILKYRTPRLPEAPGKRSGCCKNNRHVKEENSDVSDVKMLIFGDSVAAGVGCSSNEVAFAGSIGKAISNYRRGDLVHWKILGKSGYTAKDCETKLIPILERRKKSRKPGAYKQYDVCVVSIGVNHILSGHSTNQFEKELTSMLKQICKVVNSDDKENSNDKKCLILVNSMPPMEKFPQISYLKPLNLLVGYYVSLMTNVIKNVCFANADELNTYCVELSEVGIDASPDNINNMMAPDGFHPGQGANEIMAKQITDVYKERNARKILTN